MSKEIHNTSDHEIYDRVISAILDHRLQPGTKLSETKLAEAFGVSRTRIRPVLVRLANEQVVNLTHNKGATIVEPTEIEAREVFLLRRLIEPVLIELFIKQASDKDILSLKDSLEEELNAISTADIRKSIRLSGDFHLSDRSRLKKLHHVSNTQRVDLTHVFDSHGLRQPKRLFGRRLKNLHLFGSPIIARCHQAQGH
jgi:DNA-binding GntR family transcriptional regulator